MNSYLLNKCDVSKIHCTVIGCMVYMFCMTVSVVMAGILLFHFVVLIMIDEHAISGTANSSSDMYAQKCTISSLVGKQCL